MAWGETAKAETPGGGLHKFFYLFFEVSMTQEEQIKLGEDLFFKAGNLISTEDKEALKRRWQIWENALPSGENERLSFYERERAELVKEHIGADLFTHAFTECGYMFNYGFMYHIGRVYLMAVEDHKKMTEAEYLGELCGWLRVGGKLATLTERIGEIKGIFPGIADAMKKYIAGGDDETISYVIRHKALPAGRSPLVWIGTGADAGAFANALGFTPSSFNKCFAGHELKGVEKHRVKETYKDKDGKRKITNLLFVFCSNILY